MVMILRTIVVIDCCVLFGMDIFWFCFCFVVVFNGVIYSCRYCCVVMSLFVVVVVVVVVVVAVFCREFAFWVVEFLLH
jgi:hypothetical protein